MSFTHSASSMKYLTASTWVAEKAYVWCLLMSWEVLERKDIRVGVQEIYTPELAIILESIIELREEGVVADIVSVVQRLVDKGKFYPVFPSIDQSYINELMMGDFVYANLKNYETIVKENSLKISAQKVVEKLLSDPDRSAAAILARGQELISIATTWWWLWTKWFDISHAHALADKIGSLNGKDLHWFSFGQWFSFLDYATKGIQKGRTYRIGAPSNVGKTQFAYSIINNVIAQWARVMFLTLENEVQTTLGYIMSNHQKIWINGIMKGEAIGDFDYLDSIKDSLAIVDSTYYLNDIFSRIIEFKPDIVILDYIGLASIRGFTDETKYTEYAIQVQRFVKQMQISWIDLSNLPTQLQNSEDIRWNPQFFWSTFLRNNTDVGIHIMPWKEFYEMRGTVLWGDIYNDAQRAKLSAVSGVSMIITKNRLWPHSIHENFIIDFNKGAEFQPYSKEKFLHLASSFWL